MFACVSYNTCHKDRHVETLDVLRDAAAARVSWWTRVMSEKVLTNISICTL